MDVRRYLARFFAVTTIVVRGVRSEAKTPPSRSTIARVSRFESRLNLPTSETCCPANGRSTDGVDTYVVDGEHLT